MKRTHTHSRTNTCTVFSLDLSGKLKAISPANKLKANCKRSQKLIAIFLSASFCRWASRAATATAAAALAALLRVDPTSMRCARPAMRDSATAAIQKVQQQSEQFIAPNSIINRNLLVLFPSSPCSLAGVYCAGTFDGWLCWPDTAAGTSAYELCPDFITGFEPTSKLLCASLLNSRTVLGQFGCI